MRRIQILIALAAATAATATATAAAAQQPVYAPASPSRAWLGVGYEVRWIERGEECRPQVIVESVVHGAPAERAGLRAGDAILALQGSPALPARLEVLGQQLAPGDSIRLRIGRGGVERDIVAIADRRPQRPPALAPAPTALRAAELPTVVVRGDTLIGRDIERLALVPGERYVVRHPDGRNEYRRSLWDRRDRGDEMDRRVARLVACARSSGMTAGPVVVPEARKIRLRADSLRVVWGERALARAAEAPTAEPPVVEAIAAQTGRVTVRAAPDGSWQVFRFEDHAAAAERGVAGAEVTALEPELAAYFRGARSGVLVLRVSPGTPADRAGLRPGDVITAGAGTRIQDVGTLRRLLSLPDARPLELDVVRHGRGRTVTIRRE